MMASKKSSPRGARAPRRGGPPSKNKLMPYVILVGVLVVAAVAGAIILGSRKPAPKKATSESTPSASKSSKKSRTTAKSRREARRGESKTERRSKRKARESKRERGTRTSRKEAGTNKVEAIMTDDDGQRYALVGDRQFKAGDAISGRQIISIGSDQITVEYHGKTYAVRVGQSIY
jgi:hypothetical protein